MNDLSNRKLHGPVHTLKTQYATWEAETAEWKQFGPVTSTTFRPDGNISSRDAQNPDGSIAHSLFLYNDLAQLEESIYWQNDDTPCVHTIHICNEAGQHQRTQSRGLDGVTSDLETSTYDATGRRTASRLLDAGEHALHYTIEGTNSTLNAPGAASMTTRYDERDLPIDVIFADSLGQQLRSVVLTRNTSGQLLTEDITIASMPLPQAFENASADARAGIAAMLRQVLGSSFSTTSYTYDPRGRLIERNHTMAALIGTRTTYRYEEREDPVEETTENSSREASVDENGSVQYVPGTASIQHNRFSYRYDEYENWTERIVFIRLEPNLEFQPCNIERRTITYYP